MATMEDRRVRHLLQAPLWRGMTAAVTGRSCSQLMVRDEAGQPAFLANAVQAIT